MPKTEAAVPGGVPPADGRAGPGRAARRPSSRVSSAAQRQSITDWVAQAAADSGKPCRGKDVLSSAEREELARLRRENRQLKLERDILAKATAWFAGKGEQDVHGVFELVNANQADVPRAHDVPRAQGLGQRLLRVARSRAVAGARSTTPCWSSASARSTPSRMRPTACRACAPS